MVVPQPSFGGGQSLIQVIAGGDAIDVTLPNADGSGTGDLTYTLSGTLPSSLQFDGDSQLLSGAVDAGTGASSTQYVVTATDVNGATAMLTFTLQVIVPQPRFGGASQPDLHATIGGPALEVTLPSAADGVGALTYSLAPTLPSGLTLDVATLRLSGAAAADASVGNVRYTLSATDVNGTATSLDFNLRVYAQLAFVAGNQPSAVTFSVGASRAVTFLAISGGRSPHDYALDTSAISAAHSLAFNANTRILSGGFDAVNAPVDLTYIAADANGAMIAHIVNLTAIAAPNFVGNALTTLGDGYTFRVGTLVDATLPSASGGLPPLTHRLTRGANSGYDAERFALGGVAFDAATRILSGTPTDAFVGAAQYHVRDSNGATSSATANFRVFDALTLTQPNLSAATDAGVDIALSSARNAVGAVGYTLTDLDGSGLDDLPSGITYDASARTLGGDAPSAAVTAASFIYTATDGYDRTTAVVTFTLAVVEKPVFSPPRIVVTYTVGATPYSRDGVRYADSLTLPAASGGGADGVRYNVSGQNALTNLGLRRRGGRPDDRLTIEGAPTAAGDATFVRIATDKIDDTKQGTFTLIVTVAPKLEFCRATSRPACNH